MSSRRCGTCSFSSQLGSLLPVLQSIPARVTITHSAPRHVPSASSVFKMSFHQSVRHLWSVAEIPGDVKSPTSALFACSALPSVMSQRAPAPQQKLPRISLQPSPCLKVTKARFREGGCKQRANCVDVLEVQPGAQSPEQKQR